MGEKKKLNINKNTIKNLRTKTNVKTGATVGCPTLGDTVGCPNTVTYTGTQGDTRVCHNPGAC